MLFEVTVRSSSSDPSYLNCPSFPVFSLNLQTRPFRHGPKAVPAAIQWRKHRSLRGREAFAAASRSALGQVHIEAKSDIQEIRVAGDYAFCWNQLSLTVTAVQGGPSQRRAGPTLSVFRKEPDGRWILFRDANMLTAV
jgi:ketosteroid isomerase-like protein